MFVRVCVKFFLPFEAKIKLTSRLHGKARKPIKIITNFHMLAKNREQVIRQSCGMPGNKILFRLGKMWSFAVRHFRLYLVLNIHLNNQL